MLYIIGFAIISWWIAIAVGVPIYVAGQLGSARNRNGYAWGIIFGWLGVLCLYVLPEGNYKQ